MAPPSRPSIAITTAPSLMAIPSLSGARQIVADSPRGLQPLVAASGVYVRQLKEAIEIFTGISASSRYEVLDSSNGQRIFFGFETADACATTCFGSERPFTVTLYNLAGSQVLTVTRRCYSPIPRSWMLCCCNANKVKVEDADGELLGTATQKCGGCRPKYKLCDSEGELAFLLRGSSCGECCQTIWMGPCPCCNGDFRILQPDTGTEVGRFQRRVPTPEFLSDANTAQVSFPVQLEPKLKALLLATFFLINIGYFEICPQQC